MVNIGTFVVGVVILMSLSFSLGLIVAALAVPLVALSWFYESRYRRWPAAPRTRAAT